MSASTSQDLDLSAYPDLLTADDLAQLLRVSRHMVSRMHVRGDLPTPRLLGNRQRWSREEIRAWWDAGCPSRDAWEARMARR